MIKVDLDLTYADLGVRLVQTSPFSTEILR